MPTVAQRERARATSPARAATRERKTQTTLIERFLYPKYGPGQLWEEVAERVRAGGGEVRFGQAVERLRVADGRITEVDVRSVASGTTTLAADYV